jgi:hypothetical protein
MLSSSINIKEFNYFKQWQTGIITWKSFEKVSLVTFISILAIFIIAQPEVFHIMLQS